MYEVIAIDYVDITLRLVLAVILGGIIGYERELSFHFAGFRTHILVCVGSALIMLISMYGFLDFLALENVRIDPARVSAGVVTGIGFLGAGTILRHGYTVTGLTTAATLWVVAAIGLAIGAGFYYGAIIVTVLVFMSLTLFSRIDTAIIKKKGLLRLKVIVRDEPGMLGEIATTLGHGGANIIKVSITDEGKVRDADNMVVINLLIKMHKKEDIYEVLNQVKLIEGVYELNAGKGAE